MINLSSVHNELIFLHVLQTWSGGNEYAWEGKGHEFESERTCIFSNRKFSNSKSCQLIVCLLVLSAIASS